MGRQEPVGPLAFLNESSRPVAASDEGQLPSNQIAKLSEKRALGPVHRRRNNSLRHNDAGSLARSFTVQKNGSVYASLVADSTTGQASTSLTERRAARMAGGTPPRIDSTSAQATPSAIR